MAEIIAAEFEATPRRETSRFHTLEDGRTEQGLGFAVGFAVGLAVGLAVGFGVAGSGEPTRPAVGSAPGDALEPLEASARPPRLDPGDEESETSPAGVLPPGVDPAPCVPAPERPNREQAVTAVANTSTPTPAIETDRFRIVRMHRS
jgi:hypothetical protein